MNYPAIRVIISGGGTGGHIFPAISIANKMKALNLSSVRKAKEILRSFKPDIAIGVGGYASAPLLWAATRMGIPSLIQEQNGFAGLTNKILGKRVGKICVAYEGMERFFPADKIVLSGNPIREEVSAPATPEMKAEALAYYGFTPGKKHLLIVGGSLGSGTLNRAMKKWITDGCPGGEDVEVLWQCGKYYKEGVDAFMAGKTLPGIRHDAFIARMGLAYAMADAVITRSGASTVSELCAMGKAAVFVPSPNVAEDHQTHNAMALVRRDAALIVKDADAPETLLPTAMELLRDPGRIATLEKNALAMALTAAAMVICEEAYKLL